MSNRYMKEALTEAKKALLKNEVPVGAVIVKEKEIIARAHNLKESLNRVTAHAEILAIEQASKLLGTWHLEDCILYVTLEPCHMCMSAIIESRISRVVYGALDIKMGAHVSSRNRIDKKLQSELDIVGGILELDSQNLLKSFFKTLRNTKDSV